MLVNAGADVTLVNERGETALEVAQRVGNDKAVRILRKARKKERKRSPRGSSEES